MVKIFENEQLLAQQVCFEMMEQMMKLPQPVFCLACGSTPLKCYADFADKSSNMEELRKLRFVGLDEWVGIPRSNSGSCYHMMETSLFGKLPLSEEQVIFYDVEKNHLEEECKRIDSYVAEHPITYSLMGVGMNGHIGLNEPGTPVEDHSIVVPLSDTTKEVGQKYFSNKTKLEYGITLGLQQIIDSSRVVVVITGKHKREIVKEMLENPDAKLPVQEMLGKEHIDIYLDRDAASLLASE